MTSDRPELRSSFELSQLRQEVNKKREPEMARPAKTSGGKLFHAQKHDHPS